MPMKFYTVDELYAQERAAQGEKTNSLPTSPLADWAMATFLAAEQHRDRMGITERMNQSRRQAAGKYDPETWAKILKRKGSKAFHGLTETKCVATEAWMEDILTPDGGERPWTLRLRTTTLPELPPDVLQVIRETTLARFQGEAPGPAEIIEFVEALAPELERRIGDEARDRVDRTEKLMVDQLEEGGFTQAFVDFLHSLTIELVAWLKGPCIQPKPKLVWDEEGGQMSVETRLCPTFYSPDAMDMYPAPNVREIEDGPLCERIRMQKSDLRRMRDVDGWSSKGIDLVLQTSESTSVLALGEESERAAQDSRDLTKNQGLTGDQLEGIEIHSSMESKLLRDWGVKDCEEGEDQSARLLLFGTVVVYAQKNPDPLGRYPYSQCGMYESGSGLYKQSLPERVRVPQKRGNAAGRALDDNLQYISRPMPAVDLDALPPNKKAERIFPGKMHQFRSSQMKRGIKPIDFYTPPSHTNEFLTVIEFVDDDADKRSLIPAYAYGNDNVRGPGETARGFEMLLSTAAKGVRLVILRVGTKVLTPTLERLHTWDMLYHEDKSLHGDVVVVSRGLLSSLEKHRTQIRRTDFLNLVASNPMYQAVVDVFGVAEILGALATDLDMPVEKIVTSGEELKKKLETAPPVDAGVPAEVGSGRRGPR